MVHRDIKLENILLDKQTNVKICDFGLSKILRPEDKGLKERCGTLSYMAPEMINKTGKLRYNQSVDIWSAGVVLYTMIYGQYPFRGKDQKVAQEGDIII